MYAQQINNDFKLAPFEAAKSYGNYNTNKNQKTFAGEPEVAPLADLKILASWTESLEKKIDQISQTCCTNGARPIMPPAPEVAAMARDWAFDGQNCVQVAPGAGGFDSAQQCRMESKIV